MADALDELANRVEVGIARERWREHLDLDDPVGCVAYANRFAIAWSHRAQEGTHRGGTLEAIKHLDPALDLAGDRRAVANETVVRDVDSLQCSPPVPRTGTSPRAPSSRASVLDPERSHRS